MSNKQEEEQDTLNTIAELCRISSSQQKRLTRCPFALSANRNNESSSSSSSSSSLEEPETQQTGIAMLSLPDTSQLYYSSHDEIYHTPPQDSVFPSSEEQNPYPLDDDTLPPQDPVLLGSQEKNPDAQFGESLPHQDSVVLGSEERNPDALDGDTLPPQDSMVLGSEERNPDALDGDTLPHQDSVPPSSEGRNPDGNAEVKTVDLSRDSDSVFKGAESGQQDAGLQRGFDLNVEVREVGLPSRCVYEFFESQLKLIGGLKRRGDEIEGGDKKRGKILETALGLGSGSWKVESSGVQCDGKEGTLGRKIISENEGFNKKKAKIVEEGYLGSGKGDSCVRFDEDMEVIETGGNVESATVQCDSEGDKLGMKRIEDLDKYRYIGGPVSHLSAMKGRRGCVGGGLRVQPLSFCGPAEEDVGAPVCVDDTRAHNEEDQEITMLDVLRMMAQKRKPERVSTDEKVSIYKTAESCGWSFPRPRWWPEEGFSEGD